MRLARRCTSSVRHRLKLTGAATEAGKAAKASAPAPAAASAKPLTGNAAPAMPTASKASGCLMQQLEQELISCAEALQKACAMYYSPDVPEGKPSGKAKTAAPAEAANSLVPCAEGPGAITRPALIPLTAAEMEIKCASKMDAVRDEAWTHVQKAVDLLQKQASAVGTCDRLYFKSVPAACMVSGFRMLASCTVLTRMHAALMRCQQGPMNLEPKPLQSLQLENYPANSHFLHKQCRPIQAYGPIWCSEICWFKCRWKAQRSCFCSCQR